MRVAVFPGSFDPITLGHYDIVERATPLFDKIIIAIGQNSQKKYMFSLEERMEFIKRTFAHFPNVEVDHFEGLTIDYCHSKNVNFILRGLRNPSDFEFEKAIAQTNRELTKDNKIETIFLLTSASYSFISSSIVREILTFGGHYELMVPEAVRVFKNK
ncbi:pantetheine-phosphate adenylyltransferase [Chryseobacterium sp.]|uniref:pantetheine-phosphate adenylyltransferase n=1 Tax=Chryseobacterium sp. TaxID=1871047 RepID=UPI0011CA513E|nr:pantetheine-phosphate adenylyltransferase [Chryseobacterium sp.]TXF75189.1 pantetheine-phosphate adenylyltransferase [Chryseobacterium sp.]